MHAQAIRHPVPERDDERLQRAVLALVLYQHPVQLSRSEIAQEIGQGDAEQAISDLVAAGLLRRQGESVLPTRAALQFDQLAA